MSGVFTVTIRTDNASFDDPFGGDAVADILRDIAGHIGGVDRQEIKAKTILDINGNRVGQWKWEQTDE